MNRNKYSLSHPSLPCRIMWFKCTVTAVLLWIPDIYLPINH